MEKDDTSQTKEICDIYDVYGNRTGKTFVRGEPLSNGQYVMVVDVWIVNSRDEILIQKRSEQKKDLPGTWATHSGCVLAGESSLQACIREPLEEIGIHILPSQIHKLNRKLKGKLLSENFVVETAASGCISKDIPVCTFKRLCCRKALRAERRSGLV